MKYLILKSAKDDFEKFYINNMQGKNVKTTPIYKFSTGFFWRIIVLWIKKINFPFQPIWYGSWKKELKHYDTVIIFDRNLNWNIISYIKKHNPKCRIIAWHWNPSSTQFPVAYTALCEKWSFDIEDCQKYNWKYNTQFYFKNIKSKSPKKRYHAFFVGIDKGRYRKVLEIANKLKTNDLIPYIYIVKDKNSFKDTYNNPMCYTQVLEKISESACLIDIPQAGQKGLTARTLESIFLNKKLITTDKNIVNYDFYYPENILFWDHPSDNEIKKFFSTPYRKIEENILNHYTFEAWIANFEKAGSVKYEL